jgi:alkanesulfonate monooxygenase SsuD/methylene tetrahydromethanopterin reductase-like flavin-dependent oxidoreductase (luciferase family)
MTTTTLAAALALDPNPRLVVAAALAVAAAAAVLATLWATTRSPPTSRRALIARSAETIDGLSNGRLICGLGARDLGRHLVFAYPFDGCARSSLRD